MAEQTSYETLLSRISDPAGREIFDPATGDVVGHAPDGTVADLDQAVSTARAAQPLWAALSDTERADVLLRAADAIEAAAEPLAELLSREQGKPLNGPNARFEVGACAAWLRATAATDLPGGPVFDDGEVHAEIHYRPVGVVGAIGPWNWPMMITVWQIAPALRMGNSAVVKPSEYTPLSVLALGEVLNSVLPDGVLTVVSGDGELGARLSSHPDIDKLMFTGSTATGQAIIRSSADTVKRLTLELGGNDAGIVLPNVDPVAIAEGLFWGAFINTGQTCAALKRLYVHTDVYDEVCSALVDMAQGMPMGRGLDEQNVLGPLQNQAQYDVVARLVEAAQDAGAKILLGATPTPLPSATSTRRRSSPTLTTPTPSWPRSSSALRCRSCATTTWTRPSRWPTDSRSASAHPCGATMSMRPVRSRRASRREPCGSTRTVASIR